LRRDIIAVDMHSDIIVDVMFRRLKGERGVISKYHLPRFERGQVNVLVTPIVWDEPVFQCYSVDCMFRNLSYVESEIVESGGKIGIATRMEEVEKGLNEGKIILVLGTEGSLFLGFNLELLRVVYRLGVRVLGLTWNMQNQISGGAGENRDYGLSSFGLKVVSEAEKLGMIVDVSHLSNRGFWDVIEIIEKPVIASHSNVRKICEHRRNLSDEQIKAIAEKRGVMGINFYPEFVADKKELDIDDIIAHINYVVDLVGVDYVGLGPDFIDYMSDYILNVLKRDSEKLYTDRGLNYPFGLEDVTKLPNLASKLLEHGYSKNDVKKIFGENFLRVFREVVG